MSDEKQPRVRGQKDIERAFREGFIAGVQHGLDEVKRIREAEELREGALGASLARYRRELSVAPRRTRKTRTDREAERRAESREREAEGKAPFVERSA